MTLKILPCPICKTDKYLLFCQHQRDYPMRIPKQVYAFYCGQCRLMAYPIREEGMVVDAWNRLVEKINAISKIEEVK
jgi:uncharacterized protein YbaR (Trm112 family)